MIERRLRNVVISGFGAQLKRENELLKIVQKGDGDAVYVSPREVEQVIIAGESSMTSGVVRLLLENNVDLVFIEHRPNFFARVVRGDHNFITDLWRKQILMDYERRLSIAREIVDCAIYNKLRMLQSLAKNRDVDFNSEIEYLRERRTSIKGVSDNETLMGIEGDATRMYFGALRRIVPKEFGFEKRERHPPLDPMNSMLSYGYTVLRSRVGYGLMLAGLNPFEGILHSTYRDRPALGFDLIEEFRQPIVDRVVITQIVQKQVQEDGFDRRSDMCYMGEDVKRKFLDALYHRLEDKYTYKGKKLEFLDIIFEQAKALARSVDNDERYEGFRYR
ncbi:MAG: CRISPR-associated endonuclease Cas1 [Methanocellales archaeon]|nr:CRISPR-associated endonuclease Cas1 [Methanocellales archaeon]